MLVEYMHWNDARNVTELQRPVRNTIKEPKYQHYPFLIA
jgi:hypothetical protein